MPAPRRTKRRHSTSKQKRKPRHNSRLSKYQAVMQYDRVLCLPESERCLGEVTKIAKSLPIPVTRQCLLRWHAKNDRHEKLRRKEGSGTTCIMDDDSNYCKYELFVYFHNLHIVWCHIIHAFPCHLCCQQVFNLLIIWWNVASLVQR